MMAAPDSRTLIAADWVLPVADAPIADGAVLVSGNSVEAVGAREDLSRAAGAAECRHYPGCVIIPGLVNAHTHLALTALEGTSPPAGFPEWLDAVVPHIKQMSPAELTDSARMGVRRMLRAGITCVGDVTYREESLAPARKEGLAGVFFREVLGMPGDAVVGFLDDTAFPYTIDDDRLHPGLSAHAPYSTGPSAIRSTLALARERCLPAMMHVAESPAEDALLRRGEGRLASLVARLAPDFESPGTGTVTYLDGLGALDGLICVHAVHVDEDEADLLAEKARGVVLCPRSNLYLDCGSPPVEMFAARDIPMAVGTDSIASNRSFDMFEEARSLLEADPGLPPSRLLAMITAEGASVLGMHRHGRLEAGSPADLVVLALGATDDPVRDVIGAARAKDVAAVMSAGSWRVG